MTRSVFDEQDEVQKPLFRHPTLSGNLNKKLFDNVDVPLLVLAADIIYITGSSLMEYNVNRPAVVNNIYPVPYVHTIAIDRDRLASDCVGNDQGHQFLRELVRTVIIGTSCDHNIQAVGLVKGPGKKVR